MYRITPEVIHVIRVVSQSKDDVHSRLPCRFLSVVAGHQKSVLPVYDDLGICPDRTGEDNTAGAHGFNKRHPEWFLAVLKIYAEAAALHFSRQLSLSDNTMKGDSCFRREVFPCLTPQPGASVNVHVKKRFVCPQYSQDSYGRLQAFRRMTSIQKCERVSLGDAASKIWFFDSPVADINFTKWHTPFVDYFFTDEVTWSVDKIEGIRRQAIRLRYPMNK